MLATLSPPRDLQIDLLERCRAGDAGAWRELYEKHFPGVYRFAVRLGMPPAEAEDACQEVFVRVHRRLATFRGDSQFSTWIYGVALNEIRRAGRRLALRRALSALLHREPLPEPTLPDRYVAGAEGVRALQAVLARIKPKKREVFVLCELEELPAARAAEVLGCTVNTIGSRLRQAREDFARLCRQQKLIKDAGARRARPANQETPTVARLSAHEVGRS